MADGSLTSAINAGIADNAMRYAPLSAIPFVQRSAYLADALQQLRQHGGDDLKTPGALGSNLLAEAIDQFASRRATAALLAKGQQDQSGYDAGLLGLANATGALGQPGGAPAEAQ